MKDTNNYIMTQYPLTSYRDTRSDILKVLHRIRDDDQDFYQKMKTDGLAINLFPHRPAHGSNYSFVMRSNGQIIIRGSLKLDPSQLELWIRTVDRELQDKGFANANC
ncbi:hypothetical protein ACFL0V_00485 [Nanoarchaeota archaeon]